MEISKEGKKKSSFFPSYPHLHLIKMGHQHQQGGTQCGTQHCNYFLESPTEKYAPVSSQTSKM